MKERKVGRNEGKKESKKIEIQRKRDLQIDRQRYRNVASTAVFLWKNLDISFFSSTRQKTSGTTTTVPDVHVSLAKIKQKMKMLRKFLISSVSFEK